MVVKQIVPKAAFPHTASHTGKSLEREKLNKLNPEREREEKIKRKMHNAVALLVGNKAFKIKKQKISPFMKG